MKKLLSELKKLVDDLNPELLPYVSNDVIYAGNYRIVSEDNRYVIRSTNSVFPIARTYTKHGALAMLKSHSKNKKSKILEYDRILYTNDIDICFYRNVAANTKDDVYRQVVENRLFNALNNVKRSKAVLLRTIFS